MQQRLPALGSERTRTLGDAGCCLQKPQPDIAASGVSAFVSSKGTISGLAGLTVTCSFRHALRRSTYLAHLIHSVRRILIRCYRARCPRASDSHWCACSLRPIGGVMPGSHDREPGSRHTTRQRGCRQSLRSGAAAINRLRLGPMVRQSRCSKAAADLRTSCARARSIGESLCVDPNFGRTQTSL